ncbi:MAG: Fur family transcriptional regulator [Pseudomonadota bacterium]
MSFIIEKLNSKLPYKNIKMTAQRRLIVEVVEASDDHPDVEEIYQRALEKDSNISIATVYRTLKFLKESGVVDSHDFGDGRTRYETLSDEHHDHLIDIKSGKIIEFYNEKIEEIQEQIAHDLGYKIVDHRLEIYCVPIDDEEEDITDIAPPNK